MAKQQTIRWTRSEAGRYSADNGADILAGDYLSVTLTREEDGWVARYWLAHGQEPVATSTSDRLAEAKREAAMVLAARHELAPHREDRITTQAIVRRLAREAGRRVLADLIEAALRRVSAEVAGR